MQAKAKDARSPEGPARPAPAPDWGPADASDPLGLLALLRASQEAFFACDGEGIVRFWNEGAEALFGVPASETLPAAANA